jgi:hypothetical protein
MLAYPLAVVLLALQSIAAVAPAGPQYVQGCDPCRISLRSGSGSADFRFTLETVPQGRVVKAIRFERNGRPVQEMNVPSMTPLAQGESFFFGGQDINFDGWLDVLLMTEQGAANARAEYWLYDPTTERFRDLGEFPMLRVDAAHKRLSSYVSNGPAGLDFEKREYAFQGNDLIVLSEETQKAVAGRPGSYVHTIRQRTDGKLVVVHRETVRQPAAR